MDLESGLKAIEEMSLDVALMNCAGEMDILKDVLDELISDSDARIQRVKQQVEQKDFANYRIDAHSIKSNMALIGATGISEHAKKHEFAARDGEYDYIEEDYTNLIAEYEKICKEINDVIH